MATTLFKSRDWGTSPKIGVTMSYTYKRNGQYMIYDISLSIDPLTSPAYFGYYIKANIKVNGTAQEEKTLKNNSPNQWSKTLTVSWNDIKVKTSSTKPTLSCTLLTNAPRGNKKIYPLTEESDSGKLGIIPAVTPITLNINKINIGQEVKQAVNVTLNPQDSSYTHKVTYSLENNLKVGTININNKTGQLSQSLLMSFRDFLTPKRLKMQVKITCSTYVDKKLLGSSTANLQLYANLSDCIPVGDIQVTKVVPSNRSAILQNIEEVRLNYSYASPHGNNYPIERRLYYNNTSSADTNIITSLSEKDIKLILKDKRGFTSTIVKTVPLLEYKSPNLIVNKAMIDFDYGDDSSSDTGKLGVDYEVLCSFSSYNSETGIDNLGKFKIRLLKIDDDVLDQPIELMTKELKVNSNKTYEYITLNEISATVSHYPDILYSNSSKFLIEFSLSDSFEDIILPKTIKLSLKYQPIFDWSEDDFNFNIPVNFKPACYTNWDQTYDQRGERHGGAIDLDNSDITGINGLVFHRDTIDNTGEGIFFPSQNTVTTKGITYQGYHRFYVSKSGNLCVERNVAPGKLTGTLYVLRLDILANHELSVKDRLDKGIYIDPNYTPETPLDSVT